MAQTARRAGWTGCTILLDEIPEIGKISIIRNSVEISRDVVISQYKHTEKLLTKNLDSRGWLMDVLACVERLPGREFTLGEMYAFTEELQRKHPANTFVQPKIRQQLQCLRDKGYIEFLDRGCVKDKDFPKQTYLYGTYDKRSTPYLFKNRIAYGFTKNDVADKHIDNEFWISSITNYSQKAATENVRSKSECYDMTTFTKTRTFKIGGPNKFYKVYAEKYGEVVFGK